MPLAWKHHDDFKFYPEEEYIVLAEYEGYTLKIQNPKIDVKSIKLTEKRQRLLDIFVRALLIFVKRMLE